MSEDRRKRVRDAADEYANAMSAFDRADTAVDRDLARKRFVESVAVLEDAIREAIPETEAVH